MATGKRRIGPRPVDFGGTVGPSRICLGTGSFGSEVEADVAFAVLDAFVERGGTFLDTAHIYGAWVEGGWGASERTIGAWMKDRGNRERIVLGTKGGCPPLTDLTQGRCSACELRQDLEESLDRLRTDHIDLYWLHRDDPGRPVGEMLHTLEDFRRCGLVRTYGASNWTTDRLDAASNYARQYGFAGFAASQPGWALADFALPQPLVEGMLYVDDDTRRWHEETGIPVVAYSAQASGYFSQENVEWARAGFSGDPPKARHYDSSESRARLLRAMRLAEPRDVTANQIGLAYLLSQPFPVFPIMGTRNPEHVREALEAADLRLTAEECDHLRGEGGG